MSKQKHKFDLRTDYCTICGLSYRELVENYRPCFDGDNIQSIKPSQYHKEISKHDKELHASDKDNDSNSR